MARLIGVAVLALGAPTAASAGSAFSVGGLETFFETKVEFSAHQNSPDSITGYVVLDQPVFAGLNPPFHAQGHVTCYRQDSTNTATVGFEIERASGTAATFIWGGMFLYVQDNGQPAGGESLDLYANSGFFPQPERGVCLNRFPPILPLKHGNIVVRP